MWEAWCYLCGIAAIVLLILGGAAAVLIVCFESTDRRQAREFEAIYRKSKKDGNKSESL